MATLDDLLSKKLHSRSLDEFRYPKVVSKLLNYLAKKENVYDKDIIFIGNLIRVSRDILEREPSKLEGYLEKLHAFALQGIEQIKPHMNEENRLQKAHILADAGRFSEALAKQTDDINLAKSWAEEWYSDNKGSGDLTIKIRPSHAVYAYSSAGIAAEKLFKLTDNEKWLEKGYELIKRAADISRTRNLSNSAKLFGTAANYSKNAFNDTGNLRWAIRWYDDSLTAGELSINEYPKYANKVINNAIEATIEIRNRTKNDHSWIKKRYDTRLSLVDIVDSKNAGYMHSYAADDSKILFEATYEYVWAKRWYDHDKDSFELLKDKDPKHAGFILGYLGEAAQALYKLTGDITWAFLWYEHKLDSAMTKETGKRHKARTLAYTSEAAHNISKNLEDIGNPDWISWEEKSYKHNIESALASREISDLKFEAHQNSFAGDNAQKLYEATGDPNWAQKAIDGYSVFLSYYESNPNPKMNDLISQVRNKLEELKKKTSITETRPYIEVTIVQSNFDYGIIVIPKEGKAFFPDGQFVLETDVKSFVMHKTSRSGANIDGNYLGHPRVSLVQNRFLDQVADADNRLLGSFKRYYDAHKGDINVGDSVRLFKISDEVYRIG